MQDFSSTQRLYDDDPYLTEFDARVIGRAKRDGRPAVALDRTAFYPEGGGQPGDHGALNGVPVVDTQSEGELVWHLLDSGLEDGEVRGKIDWARRFDFMQQHHGQHLLSAAFEQLFDARTVSVHLGEQVCTVDVVHAGLTPDQFAAVEELTNDIIVRDLPVEARFVAPDEIQALRLRKPPGAFERVRIVSAGDFDHSPCGGTHPRRTGEAGCVVLRCWERRGEALRVEFLCGLRAIRDYRHKNALANSLAASLSVGVAELPAAVERIRAAEARSRKAVAAAEEQLLGYEAAALLAGAPRQGNVPIVARVFEGRALDKVRRLAQLIANGGGIALLGVRGAKAQLVFARAGELPYDMGALLHAAATLVGGRGGGRPEAAQGGGPDVSGLDAAIARARELIVPLPQPLP